MQYGVGFPQNQMGSDPIAIRDFAQAAEGAGFDYLSTYEHIAGAHPDRFEGVDTGFAAPPYLHEHEFHEPFALFSYLAALTKHLTFSTSILVLPQRQTVLVAKQAAELSILSGRRFRLGVGVGWNNAEYEALGEDFTTRGRRQEEQIEVMRLLWTQPLVSFEGRWHHLDRIAIAPRPPQPVPVWLGTGATEPLMRRVARLADGWMPMLPVSRGPEVIGRLRTMLDEEGRDPAAFGLQVNIEIERGEPKDWISAAKTWQSLGLTHLGLRSRYQGISPMQGLQNAIEARKLIEAELG
jgi:probable F420-dependent oxidoreductase